MTERTALQLVIYGYEIAKQFVEEMNDISEFTSIFNNEMLNFVIIRDHPFLEQFEVDVVRNNIKVIVQLAIDEKILNERKSHEHQI